MRWRYSFHRIERSCCVYQPRHTAPNERAISACLCIQRSREQTDKAEEPPAQASPFSRSLNAYEAAGFALLRRIGSPFTYKHTPRCRSPPVESLRMFLTY